MSVEFQVRVNELEQPSEIVDREGATVTALPVTTRATAEATVAALGWRLLPGQPWRRFIFAPGSFTRPVERIPELWVSYGGWCPTGHPMRSTMLVADAAASTVEADMPTASLFVACLACFRGVTLNRLPAAEPLDGPVTEYGIFEFDEPASGPLLDAVARGVGVMRCMEQRHTDRARAASFLNCYSHAVVAQACPEHVGEMAAWCARCPESDRLRRPHVVAIRPQDQTITLTVNRDKSDPKHP